MGGIASTWRKVTYLAVRDLTEVGQLLGGGDDLGLAVTGTSTRVELRRATSPRLRFTVDYGGERRPGRNSTRRSLVDAGYAADRLAGAERQRGQI
jgi:hypothetical protein